MDEVIDETVAKKTAEHPSVPQGDPWHATSTWALTNFSFQGRVRGPHYIPVHQRKVCEAPQGYSYSHY